MVALRSDQHTVTSDNTRRKTANEEDIFIDESKDELLMEIKLTIYFSICVCLKLSFYTLKDIF